MWTGIDMRSIPWMTDILIHWLSLSDTRPEAVIAEAEKSGIIAVHDAGKTSWNMDPVQIESAVLRTAATLRISLAHEPTHARIRHLLGLGFFRSCSAVADEIEFHLAILLQQDAETVAEAILCEIRLVPVKYPDYMEQESVQILEHPLKPQHVHAMQGVAEYLRNYWVQEVGIWLLRTVITRSPDKIAPLLVSSRGQKVDAVYLCESLREIYCALLEKRDYQVMRGFMSSGTPILQILVLSMFCEMRHCWNRIAFAAIDQDLQCIVQSKHLATPVLLHCLLHKYLDLKAILNNSRRQNKKPSDGFLASPREMRAASRLLRRAIAHLLDTVRVTEQELNDIPALEYIDHPSLRWIVRLAGRSHLNRALLKPLFRILRKEAVKTIHFANLDLHLTLLANLVFIFKAIHPHKDRLRKYNNDIVNPLFGKKGDAVEIVEFDPFPDRSFSYSTLIQNRVGIVCLMGCAILKDIDIAEAGNTHVLEYQKYVIGQTLYLRSIGLLSQSENNKCVLEMLIQESDAMLKALGDPELDRVAQKYFVPDFQPPFRFRLFCLPERVR